MRGPFTGRHMTMVMFGGFGIVIAVNLVMATLAVGGFSGVVVRNSYVASQQFNAWLQQTKDQNALGWDIVVSRMDDDRVRVDLGEVPDDATIAAVARRPIGEDERRTVTFAGSPSEGFVSSEPLPEGRWFLRLEVNSGQDKWRSESELP